LSKKPPLKTYSIEKSSLFRCGRKRDLAELLKLTLPELKSLTKDDQNFREWFTKDRLIEQPHLKLSNTLKHLHKIIQRVETPSYLLSGKRGIKPSDNALMHCENQYMVNIDISKFFQSTRREFVFRCFRDEFQQTKDVASLLADLVTYNGRIPTGTSTSQIIAFWAYKKTFDRINNLCVKQDIRMSVWVDDITFTSSKPFPKSWVSNMSKIFSKVSLTLKASKTKKYGSRDHKIVTGSAIDPIGQLRVKNKKRQEIVNLLKGKCVKNLSSQEARRLLGMLQAQRQNEPDFFEGVYIQCKNRTRELRKK